MEGTTLDAAARTVGLQDQLNTARAWIVELEQRLTPTERPGEDGQGVQASWAGRVDVCPG